MRIISGANKGFIIKIPKGLPVRPTTDYCKESLFNILVNAYDFQNLSVLDLFAGTAGISLEFLSRGVKKLKAIDHNDKCCRFITSQFRQLNYGNAECGKADALKFLSKTPDKYDIIFADPPYDYRLHEQLHLLIFQRELLNEGGLFILEHGKETQTAEFDYLSEQRNYGQSILSFFKSPLKK